MVHTLVVLLSHLITPNKKITALKHKYLCSLTALLFSLILSPSSHGGEVISISSFSFGNIDMFPGGDDIIIDASAGPAIPTANRSVITGGGSGKIVITSDVVESVDIDYPTSIMLSDGDHLLKVDKISEYSEYSSSLINFIGDGSNVEVSVGGRLHLQGNEIINTYTGSMIISINFI